MLLEVGLILLPFSRKKDEVVKLAAPSDDRNIFQRFLENDIDVAMHIIGVRDPPQVQPVGVQLKNVSKFRLGIFLTLT